VSRFKAIVFDFGGVFTTSPVENFAVYEKQNGLPEKFIGGVIKSNIHGGAFSQFERAEISREEFDVAFAAETKAAGHEIRGELLLSMLSLKIYPEMVDALKRVKNAGYKTGCITNNMPSHDSASMVDEPKKAAEIAAIFRFFDHVIESSKTGVRKPEPRIYEMMCEALAVAPESCVFIDDLGVNLKPARAMGMTTIKAPIGGVAPAIKELNALLAL
jgi:putative hydrolase of the HAD superfamily